MEMGKTEEEICGEGGEFGFGLAKFRIFFKTSQGVIE